MEEHTSASAYIPSSSVLQRLLGKSKAADISAATAATAASTPTTTVASSSPPLSSKSTTAATATTKEPEPSTRPSVAPTYASVIRQSLVVASSGGAASSSTTSGPVSALSTSTVKHSSAAPRMNAASTAMAPPTPLSTGTTAGAHTSTSSSPALVASHAPHVTCTSTGPHNKSNHPSSDARTNKKSTPATNCPLVIPDVPLPHASAAAATSATPEQGMTSSSGRACHESAEKMARSPLNAATMSPHSTAATVVNSLPTPPTNISATPTQTEAPRAAEAAEASVCTTPRTLLAEEDVSFIMASLTWHVDLLLLLLQHAPSPLRVNKTHNFDRKKADVSTPPQAHATARAPPAPTTTAITPISGWVDLFLSSPSSPTSLAANSGLASARARRDKGAHCTRSNNNDSSGVGLGADEDALHTPPSTSATTDTSAMAGTWLLDTNLFPSLEEAQQYWLSTGAGGGGRRRNRTFFAPTPLSPRSPAPSTGISASRAAEGDEEKKAGHGHGHTADSTAATATRTSSAAGSGALGRRATTSATSTNAVSRLITHTATRTTSTATFRTPTALPSGFPSPNPLADVKARSSPTASTASAAAAAHGMSKANSTQSLASLTSFSVAADEVESRAPTPTIHAIQSTPQAGHDDAEHGEVTGSQRAPRVLALSPASVSAATVLPDSSTGSGATPYHKSKRRAGRGRRCAKRTLKRYTANFLPIAARAHLVYAGDWSHEENGFDADGNAAQTPSLGMHQGQDQPPPPQHLSDRVVSRVNAWEKGEAGQRLFPRQPATTTTTAMTATAAERTGSEDAAASPSLSTRAHTKRSEVGRGHDGSEKDSAAASPPLIEGKPPLESVSAPHIDIPRAVSLDSLSATLVCPSARPTWLYGRVSRPLNHTPEAREGVNALPSAPRHDRAHVLAQLLTSKVSLRSMYSGTETEEEEDDETRAEAEAFAAVESEEEAVLSSAASAKRARHRHVTGTMKSTGVVGSGNGSARGMLGAKSRLSAADIAQHARSAFDGSRVDDAAMDEDAASTHNSVTSDRIRVPLKTLDADAAQALLTRSAKTAAGDVVDVSAHAEELRDEGRLLNRRGSVAGSVDSHSTQRHGRRHKRFFYSAQPMLDKQKERRKSERIRKRREDCQRMSGSDASSISSTSSISGSSRSGSSSSDSAGEMSDESTSGVSSAAARAYMGSSASSASGSVRGHRSRRARQRKDDFALSTTTAVGGGGDVSSRTPYSCTASGYTPPLLSRSENSIALPSPRQPLPSSSSTVSFTPASTSSPSAAQNTSTATGLRIDAGRGPQVKVLAKVPPRPPRCTKGGEEKGNASATTAAAETDSPSSPSNAVKLPDRYPVNFFLQKFIRAVLIVLIAQVRWQQPQAALPILCGRLAHVTSAMSAVDGTPAGESSSSVPSSPSSKLPCADDEHPLFAALGQPCQAASSVETRGFQLNVVEYKALSYVRAHLPAFRAMVSTFVMRGANEVMRRSSQPLLARRVVEDTLAEFDKASRAASEEKTPDKRSTTPALATAAVPAPTASVANRFTPPPNLVEDRLRVVDTLQQLGSLHDTLNTQEVGSLYSAAGAASCYHHRLSEALGELVEDVEPLATTELYLSGKDAAWQPLLLEVQNVTRVLQCYAEATRPFDRPRYTTTALDSTETTAGPAGEVAEADRAERAGNTNGDRRPTSSTTTPHHHLLLSALKAFVVRGEEQLLAAVASPSSSSSSAGAAKASSRRDATDRTGGASSENGPMSTSSTTHTHAVDVDDANSRTLVQALMKTDEVVESRRFLDYLEPFLCSSAAELAHKSTAPGGGCREVSSNTTSPFDIHCTRGLSHSQSVPVLPTAPAEKQSRRNHAEPGANLPDGHALRTERVPFPTPGLLDPLRWHAYAYFPDAYPQLQTAQPGQTSAANDHYMMLHVAALPISGRLIYKWEIPAEDTDRFNLSVFFQSSLFSFLQGGAIPPPTCADGASFVQSQARHVCALMDAAACAAQAVSPSLTASVFRSSCWQMYQHQLQQAGQGRRGPTATISSGVAATAVPPLAAPFAFAGAMPPTSSVMDAVEMYASLVTPLSQCAVLVHCSAGMHRSCGMVLAFMLWLLFQAKKMMAFRHLRESRRVGNSNSNSTAASAITREEGTTGSPSPREAALPHTTATSAGGASVPPPPSRTLEICMAHVKRCRGIAEPIPTVQFLLEHFARELQVDSPTSG